MTVSNVPPDISVALAVFTALTNAGRTLEEPELYATSARLLGEYLSRAVAGVVPPAPEPVTPVVTGRR
jgi:hypothetical protein